MPQGITFVAADEITDKTYTEFGLCQPGLSADQLIGAKNNDATPVVAPIVAFYPNQQNGTHLNTGGSYPVVFSRIVCQDDNGNMQATDVLKESADAVCTKLENRYTIFKYNGTSFETSDYSTGNIPLPTTINEIVYFLTDYIIPVFHGEFDTFGSYENLIIERWNGTEWTATGITDGTLGATQDGNIDLGSLTLANHPKVEEAINGKFGHAWRIRCTGAITTPAVMDIAYYEYEWELEYCCLLGVGKYYDKTPGTPDTYSEVTPTNEYANMGRINFNTNPLNDPGNSLAAEYSYKIPQPGTYLLTFSNVNTTALTASCQVNGGSNIGIRIDSVTRHANIIQGMEFIFSSGLTNSGTATIEISESVKWDWYALPDGAAPGTYQNKDMELPNIPAGEIEMFYHKNDPPNFVTTTKNKQSGLMFVYEP